MTNNHSILRTNENFEVVCDRKSLKCNVLKNYIDQISTNEEYNVYEIDSNVEWDDLVQFRQKSECKEFNIIIDKFEGSYEKRFPRDFWKNEVSHKLYMLTLRIKLTFYRIESLYKIRKEDYHHGEGLLNRKYNGSPYQLLTSLYPEYEWLFWKFGQAPSGSWDSKENQLKYMNWLGETLGYTTKEDWYKVTVKDLDDNYGASLLRKYYNSTTSQLVTSLYPEYEWLFWKFTSAPKNFWDSKENQLKYITWLGEQLGYTTEEDWYKITGNDYKENHGSGLLSNYYDDSCPYKLLTSLYPEYEWLFWKFTSAPKNSWDSKENQLKYMTWLGEQLGYKTKEDWYKITQKDIENNYGSALLSKYYNHSYSQLLTSLYPEYEWLFWKFTVAPNNSWDSKENQLKYMAWLGEQLGYTTMDDWYKVFNNDFHTNYGCGLISKYNNSPYQLLISVFPEHNWLFWKFGQAPSGSWNSNENQLKYIYWLGETLGYTTMEDWYDITVNDVFYNYGSGLLTRHYNGSPYQLLSSVYPNYKWERSKFRKQYSKQQIDWLNFLQKYYDINIQHACNDGEYGIPETRYHADGFCRDTNTIYEYNGDYWHGNPKIFQPDDLNKTTKCTHGELYQKTLKKEEDIRMLGYNLVTMWESDWLRITNSIRNFQKKFRSHRSPTKNITLNETNN